MLCNAACTFRGHKLQSLGSTKPPAHPEDGDGVSSRNVGRPSHLDAAVCPKKKNSLNSVAAKASRLIIIVIHTTAHSLYGRDHSNGRVSSCSICDMLVSS